MSPTPEDAAGLTPDPGQTQALALLEAHRPEGAVGWLHLDLGCGAGRLAEAVAATGLTYLGLDRDEAGLAALRARGFEAHRAELAGEEETYAALRRAVGGRKVASISLLDTLGQLVEGEAVLRGVARLAAEHGARVVVSVPNVARDDIALRLAFGRWEEPARGDLRFFDAEGLDRVLRGAGLYAFDRRDVMASPGAPATHPALAQASQLHEYLVALRRAAGADGAVDRFVRICAPAAPERPVAAPAGDEPDRPFLSVVVRTQGKRPHTLTEVLTALAAQTVTDFEVLVIGHRLPPERLPQVEGAIADTPAWLRDKCRLVRVEEGNRTRPLNEGFAAARGRYIAIMDDDDLPFAHWVETFRALAEQSPGRLLRAACIRQVVDEVSVGGRLGLRALNRPETPYLPHFDHFLHLTTNDSPNHCLAFPRGVFHDLGLRFDEELTTTEDWDFIIRVMSLVGTASSPEITSIYRWWRAQESSRTVHPREEWNRNHDRIVAKMDRHPVLLPAGSLALIRKAADQVQHFSERAQVLAEESRAAREEGQRAAERCRELSDRNAVLERASSPERLQRLAEVMAILTSTSWQVSGPLRLLSRLRGHRPPDHGRLGESSLEELEELLRQLRASTSWRVTAPLRRLGGG